MSCTSRLDRDFHSLEDTILQATEYTQCAQAVAQQAIGLQPKSPVAMLMMASVHELEALRELLEAVLVQVQMPAETRVMH
ncbi:hypothetical protein ACNFB1_15245 [Pseudomonas sp. NY15349]|uniref:hypothetical protein n=1 Tax=unclassified Pseudomonas TaxID=196821 RepID=UPI003839F2DD